MARPKRQRREKRQRLEDFVAKLLGGMKSYGEIVDDAVQVFACDESTAKRAIARVRAQWREAAGASVEERRARFLGELEYAWQQALAAADFRAIAVMARTRADVEGIRAPKKVEHAGTLGLRPVAAMSPAEREREIQLLLAKRQAAMGNGAAPALPPASEPVLVEAEVELEAEPEVVRAPAKSSKPRRRRNVH
jgi:hypothetical protein